MFALATLTCTSIGLAVTQAAIKFCPAIHTSMRRIRTPIPFVWAVIIVCALPTLLNLLGVDFGSPVSVFNARTVSGIPNDELINAIHHTLSGSFVHTILEWSAFCTSLFIIISSFIHFYIKRDGVILIIGVAFFCAGCLDAFHTLAADRLIHGVADYQNLVPFTWAICRLFNALILLGGAGIFLVIKQEAWQNNLVFVAIPCLAFSVIAYALTSLCAYSTDLPVTIFPHSVVTRPWDVVPFLLFILAGFVVFPRLYYKYPSLFSHALVVSVIPQIATQLHMIFGSTALFDNHFNIAHFLKIVAYAVPLAGLLLDYIYMSQFGVKSRY